MTAHDNDPLVVQLAELAKALDAENIPVILGGGMSLYLRRIYLSAITPRYPFVIPARSTGDLDLFLSAGLIVDAQKVRALRGIIGRLGYSVLPEARNFQFGKRVLVCGQERTVKIDLLAAPPRSEDAALVIIHRPRIKPKGVENVHAYLTDECEGIDFGKIPVKPGLLAPDLVLKNEVLFLPSALNFLVLKLHAFRDRRNDEVSGFGRHHAWDIFSTVAGMGEADWAAAKEQLAAQGGRPYLVTAAGIRKELFAGPAGLGLGHVNLLGVNWEAWA